MDDKVGCSFVTYTKGKEFGNRIYRLSDNCSVFMAEVMAIKLADEYIIEQHWDNCTIATDSRSALKALEPLNEKREIYNVIKSKIIKYDKGIKLHWVKLHMGQTGNETADEFAKLATKKLHVDFNFSIQNLKSRQN
ncbi:hypothetical protein AVEN_223265-1 [Araneus ventricosus]|uniref:RNase H type-1 domain-containing protein n=1 Tax=Araneus ventricosus TaxID=182803 RepID=A0A4Y2NU94_ARAVE|nr:hypothetical protein AVEN_223265-1 [Araneus ventricosus]